MNVQDWGAIGEVVAAIGVIASLVYLATQIRQSTKTSKAQTQQAVAQMQAQANSLGTEIGPFRHQAYYRPETLSADQKAKLDFFFAQGFNAVQSIYFMYLEDMVDAAYWRSQLSVCRFLLAYPGIRRCWEEMGRQFYDARFVAEIEREVLHDVAGLDRLAEHNRGITAGNETT